MRKEPELGSIVLSMAGHDQGKLFVVLEILDEQYVRIADGDLRTVEKPKRKKKKHLKVLSADPMAISKHPQLLNADIRKFLKKYMEENA